MQAWIGALPGIPGRAPADRDPEDSCTATETAEAAPRRRSELGLLLVGGVVVILGSFLVSLAASEHLPRRALSLVLDWAELHQAELLTDWELCRAKQKPLNIAPLE